jgi:hypothetical protein
MNNSEGSPSSEEIHTLDAEFLIGAINPQLCIRCTSNTHNDDINTICSSCDAAMTSEEGYVFQAVLKIYNFTTAFRFTTTSDVVGISKDPDSGNTVFGFRIQEPGMKGFLPIVEEIKLDTTYAQLKNAERMLLNQCLLSFQQCHLVVILLPDLLEEIFLKDPKSPVAKIEEIYYNPWSAITARHFTHRLTLKSGNRLAVSFTDRQLGWLEIVRDWEAYMHERVLHVAETLDLGGTRGEVEIRGIQEELSGTERCAVMQEKWCAAASKKIVQLYRGWETTGRIG